MCIGLTEWNPRRRSSSIRRRKSKKQHPFRPLNLHRRMQKRITIAMRKDSEMEMKNLRLFMENQSIIEENEKLRKRALFLHQENSALLLQLQQLVVFSSPNSSLKPAEIID